MRIENLKASVLNVSEYRAELAAVVEELTGIKAASSATIRDLFRAIERHGASERRHAARANKVSPRVLPA